MTTTTASRSRFDGRCTTVTTRYTYTTTFTPVGEAHPAVDEPSSRTTSTTLPEPDTESRTETETEKTCIGEESALHPVGVLGTFGTAAAAPRASSWRRATARGTSLPADTIFDTLLAGLRAVRDRGRPGGDPDVDRRRRVALVRRRVLGGVRGRAARRDGLRARRRSRAGGVLLGQWEDGGP